LTISTGKFMTNGTGQGQEAAAVALHGKGKRLDGVDVIRGLCIMNVVLHHTNIRIHFAESSLGALPPKTAINALFWTGDYAWALARAGILLMGAAWFRGIARQLRILDNGLDVTVLAVGARCSFSP
jgi:uncharacterized membrane protein